MNARRLVLVALCVLFAGLSVENVTGLDISYFKSYLVQVKRSTKKKSHIDCRGHSSWDQSFTVRLQTRATWNMQLSERHASYTSHFLEADHLTYPRCFLTGEFQDYCSFLTFRESDAHCYFITIQSTNGNTIQTFIAGSSTLKKHKRKFGLNCLIITMGMTSGFDYQTQIFWVCWHALVNGKHNDYKSSVLQNR